MNIKLFILLVLVVLTQIISCTDYDIIVIGSGPGGAVAAKRAVDEGYSVLVLERGKPYNTVPAVDDPASTALTRATTDTGNFFNALPQPTILGLSTPKVFSIKDAAYAGGATAINGEIHVRGDAERFFDQDWPSSWDWDTMKPYYKKYETFDGADPHHVRGRHGPVHVTERKPEDNLLTQEFINATIENWPHVVVVPNINSADGVGTSGVETTSFDGHRVTSYSAYIRDLESAGALTFLTNTLVQKVNFDVNKKATGVTVWNSDSTTTVYNANKAVIVAAGTLGTPQVLQRSGIGKASDLTALGISVVSDLPDVGQNLDDHSPTITLIFVGPAPWVDLEGVLYGWLFWNTKDKVNKPPNFSIELNTVSVPPDNIKVFSLALLGRKSRGSIKITSTNPTVAPAFDLAYLTDSHDYNRYVDALNQTLELVNVLGWTFRTQAGNNPCTPSTCFDKESTAAVWLAGGIMSPGYHFTSTSKIGKVVKKDTMEVKGVKNLYVCDASVFPNAPRANTQSTTYAVAERAIKLILDDL